MVEEWGNSVVHQGVRLDKVQVCVVQLLAVVRARTCKHLKYTSCTEELLVYDSLAESTLDLRVLVLHLQGQLEKEIK